MKFDEIPARVGCWQAGCDKPTTHRIRLEISEKGRSKSTIRSFCEDHAVQRYIRASTELRQP